MVNELPKPIEEMTDEEKDEILGPVVVADISGAFGNNASRGEGETAPQAKSALEEYWAGSASASVQEKLNASRGEGESAPADNEAIGKGYFTGGMLNTGELCSTPYAGY